MTKIPSLLKIIFGGLLVLTLTGAQSQCSRRMGQDTKAWLCKFKTAAEAQTPYYSQFDHYPARTQSTLQSEYAEKTGVNLQVYGLDFYYASGSWFSDDYKARCRANLVAIVRQAWEAHKAIPCFSWHLENPYVPSSFNNYMACRYRYGEENYPNEHRYVVKEILENTGGFCGFGRYNGKDSPEGYANPAEWFDARCKEVADIICELKDDKGRPIPIIFRLWHECEGNWQWWGARFTDAEDYIRLFKLTVVKIEQHTGTGNIIYAYGTDKGWNTEEEFMLRYPGDEFVDMIGFDDYSIGRSVEALEATINRAKIVSKIASERGKVAALFESSNKDKAFSDTYYNDFILPIIQSDSVHLGMIQFWSGGTLKTEEEIADRSNFLKSGVVRTFNNRKK